MLINRFINCGDFQPPPWWKSFSQMMSSLIDLLLRPGRNWESFIPSLQWCLFTKENFLSSDLLNQLSVVVGQVIEGGERMLERRREECAQVGDDGRSSDKNIFTKLSLRADKIGFRSSAKRSTRKNNFWDIYFLLSSQYLNNTRYCSPRSIYEEETHFRSTVIRRSSSWIS